MLQFGSTIFLFRVAELLRLRVTVCSFLVIELCSRFLVVTVDRYYIAVQFYSCVHGC